MTPFDPYAAQPAARPPLLRSRRGRRLAGVCVGIADHVGVQVRLVRFAMIALTLFGGAGVLAYLFIWALTPDEGSIAAPSLPGRVGAVPAGVSDPPPGERSLDSLASSRWAVVVVLGAVIVLAGAAAIAGQLGVDLAGSFLVPVFVIAGGAVIAWSHLDDAQRGTWLGTGSAPAGYLWIRTALGMGLAVIGILVLVTQGQSVTAVWNALLAALAVLVGATVIAAPWAVRLWANFRAEQEAKARATERADIAAHLHDSVLQTLALIQRHAGDAPAVGRLARSQERELRAYLYAGPQGSADTLASAITGATHEVEDVHGIPIELVVTGDRAMDPHGAALVKAWREALLNAVRHGRPPVTAYAEIGPDGIAAYVRDRGEGFDLADLADVADDRLGVRGSILARMERHGGTASIRRRDDGTEVELTLPPIAEESP